jgi:hypothetical protein
MEKGFWGIVKIHDDLPTFTIDLYGPLYRLLYFLVEGNDFIHPDLPQAPQEIPAQVF